MENSKIEWTDHTLNFWWGCFKVSDGCKFCYAETFSNRVGRNIWGPSQTTERWRTKAPWRDCLKWDTKAESVGIRHKVFCQSMSDFFEDHPQVEPWRKEAVQILEGFNWLDVQLLTKRPENVLGMVPSHWLKNWPEHIWVGTSVESQEYADKRIPELLKIPARVRFLSCEPLLSPVDLVASIFRPGVWNKIHFDHDYKLVPSLYDSGLHWVITGGESGKGARPCHPDWVRFLRDQCQVAGIPYFFKQWGEWQPVDEFNGSQVCRVDPDGKFYTVDHTMVHNTILRDKNWQLMARVGKHNAGRLLDGVEWNEFPTP